MGLDDKATQFLLAARQLGVSFEQVVTIGRQQLYIAEHTLQRRLRTFGLPADQGISQRLLRDAAGSSEPFLELLGAIRTESIDASEYEGASQIFDLNGSLPQELNNAFSVVLDAGTLEHVFDFPTAIRNCMQMVSLGGHFLCVTTANNMTGHGFYQFSPELFYRVFSESNGFRVDRMYVTETSSSTWYEVSDPASVGGRVQLRTFRPTYLCVIAKRVEITPILVATPRQSDYVARWNDPSNKHHTDSTRQTGLHPIERHAPHRIALLLKSLHHLMQAAVLPFDKKAFTRIDIENVTSDSR